MNYSVPRTPRTLNINYQIVTPQTNDKLCKYICHARTESDMGHLTVWFEWENVIKPTNSKEYEKNIERIVCEHFDEYGTGYTANNGAYPFQR